MNSNTPFISVVIPAYNEEKYIADCLNSLKNQTFKNFEIIVVDNNSTDQTEKIARNFGVTVIKEEKQGITNTREKGFSTARSEIIARTDADSIVSPTWLEQIYESFSENPDLVALTGSFTSPYKFVPSIFFHLYTLFLVYLSLLFTGHIPLHGPNMALKKSAWEKVKIHRDDKLVHEDIDLACHLAPIGKMKFIPNLKTTYSLRRLLRSPLYTIAEYHIRYVRTIHLHHPFFR